MSCNMRTSSLCKPCTRDHKHGSLTKGSAIYTPGLAEALAELFAAHLKFERRLRREQHAEAGGLESPLVNEVTKGQTGNNLTGEVHFRAPALSYALRTKTGTFFVTLFSPISIALRPSRPASRPASKLAPKCFVLIPWSRDAGARDLH